MLQVSLFKKQAYRTIILYIQTDPFNNGWRLHAAKRHSKTGCALLASRYSFLLSELRDKIAELSESNRQQLILNSDNQEAYFEQKTIHSTLRSHLPELDVELVVGVRLENGNYPTLRLFFVQCGVDCA